MQQQPSISERLADEQSDVRASAVLELLQSGADAAPHVKALADCLSDPSESLRLLALLLLGRLGAPAAEYLAAALDPLQPESFRAVAAAIIAGIGPEASASIRNLCRCLTSTDGTLRNAAAIALGKTGEAAVPSLRRMLQFPNPETVAAAIESLTMIGPPAAEAVPDIEALAPRLPVQLQLSCAAALACLTGDPLRGFPALSKMLQHPDPLIRKTAAEKISGLGPAAHPAVPGLMQCAADPDETVRAAAVLTLGRIRAPHDQAVPGIAARLGDPAAEVRYAAAVVLAGYGADARAALTALRACLQDPVEKVAKCVGAAIEKIEFGSS